jgi:hypothetical protein
MFTVDVCFKYCGFSRPPSAFVGSVMCHPVCAVCLSLRSRGEDVSVLLSM